MTAFGMSENAAALYQEMIAGVNAGALTSRARGLRDGRNPRPDRRARTVWMREERGSLRNRGLRIRDIENYAGAS
jgi:hypothetical protein